MLNALLTILIIAPLAYGTTGSWAQLLVQGAVFGLLLVWALAVARGRRRAYRVPGTRLLLLLGIFLLLQCLPLPPAMLKILSPTAWRHYSEGVWLVSPGSWLPLSINPRASLLEIFQLFSGIAVYFLAVQLIDSRVALRRTLTVVVCFAGLYALLAIFYSLFPNGRILWVLHPWPPGTAQQFGTYVNGNHYAGLMGMLLPLCVAWFLVHKPQTSYSNWREQLVDFFSDPQASPHLLFGMGSLLVAVSIFISGSRGGILSCCGALLLFGLLLVLRGFDRRRGILLAVFFALLLGGVGIFGWEPIFADFARLRAVDGSLQEQRPDYWRDSGQMLADYPLAGTGVGTFADVYRGYQTVPTFGHVVDHAHNDYIEWATDNGLVGSLLLTAALLTILFTAWRQLRRRRTLMSNYLGIGCLAGLGSIALHSLTDFNLRIGANLLWFALLWGLLIAAAATRSRAGRVTSDLVPAGGRSGRIAAPAAMVLLFSFLVLRGGVCGGLLAFAPVEGVNPREIREPGQLQALLGASRQAAARDPLQADYHFAVGNLLRLSGNREEAFSSYLRALRCRPLDGEILQQTGLLLAGQGRDEAAESLLLQAAALDRMTAERLRVLGNWQLRQGRREDGVNSLRRALALEPKRTRNYLTLLILSGFSDRELRAVLPSLSGPWLDYGDYLVERGMTTAAEEVYRRSLALADGENNGSGAYHRVARYYARRKEWALALQVITEGLERRGGDASLYRAAGIYDLRSGLDLQAREAFQQALRLNPRDKWVRKQLQALNQGDVVK
ncbi:O-antigen ligase family protein [Geothermobacter hydrogeniphilus]|uniref:O-antigen ligase-related domain-containing protein n=1 Tax=Geothermobacter hydrogeniphilus TaxID=1969733 RepID=A0A1X0XSI6_9BACT|nr:O-antigen ligase family protein [Geothermobacter hydrogeniphilus]ORJ55865.1 hypothetical protein B5V00_14790 [Geothermobacter hydrogeniphilus]